MPKTAQQCEAMRADMRERILQASLLYFARNGFAGVRMSDLAKSIGIGQGTVYLYFDSKEVLFREVRELIDNKKDVDELRLLSKLPVSAKRKIHRLTETVVRRLAEDKRFAASVVLNTQLLLEEGEATYQSSLYAHTAHIIEQGQREGSVVDGDPFMLADYYWGVAYLYALKKLFTAHYTMIGAVDMERTLLRQEG